MSDDSNVKPEKDYAVIRLICDYLSDGIVSISRHHPEWLSEKFRDGRFIQPNFKVKLSAWLAAKLSRASDRASLTRQIMKIWTYFTVPSFFLTSEFASIMTDIGRVLYSRESITQENYIQESIAQENATQESIAQENIGYSQSGAREKTGAIAVLLLDAENTNIPANAEKILADFCTYPLQVKIAFANWRYPGLGNKDAELHARGYQLLHAPEAKNGADAHMIAMGASIHRYYPHTKEVFVCSADTLLLHLCNSLQNQGFKVYRVRRNKDTIEIENRYNGEVRFFSINTISRNLFQELARELEENIDKLESSSIEEKVAQLSNLIARFQKQAPVSANANEADLASTLAEQPQIISADTEALKAIESHLSVLSVNSLNMLDEFMLDCVRYMTEGGALEYISADRIIKHIRAQYDKDINLIVKKFKPDFSLIKYLRSRPSLFELKLVGKEYRVALANQSPAPEITTVFNISSRSDLEKIVIKIIETYTAKSPGSYIIISDVATAFYKQYGQPITKVMQTLQLGNKFIKLLQSCNNLKLQQDGKIYKVAIAT
ncbi:MAG: NYN domain-containing protein [Oscillatoria sp. SIO1A7]|nr:NYN domain-containing protein [Oscillatoria sp. SIO1A7]